MRWCFPPPSPSASWSPPVSDFFKLNFNGSAIDNPGYWWHHLVMQGRLLLPSQLHGLLQCWISSSLISIGVLSIILGQQASLAIFGNAEKPTQAWLQFAQVMNRKCQQRAGLQEAQRLNLWHILVGGDLACHTYIGLLLLLRLPGSCYVVEVMDLSLMHLSVIFLEFLAKESSIRVCYDNLTKRKNIVERRN